EAGGPQRLREPALADREHGASVARVAGERADLPRQCARLERAARRVVLARPRQALIEDHRDVCAEPPLDLHGALGREPHLASVHVVPERDAVVVDGPRTSEREDLEAAGIREDRALPAHEAVQAAGLLDDVLAGAYGEVIRVA